MVKKSKLWAVLLLLALGLACLAGCGGTEAPEEGGEPAVTGEPSAEDKPAVTDEPAAEDKPAAEDSPEATGRPAAAEGAEVIKTGTLAFTNISEEDFDAKLTEVAAQQGWEAPKLESVYFDTLSAMLLALQAGQIDNFMVPATVADYIVADNDALIIKTTPERPQSPQMALSMAVLDEDTALLALLNDAFAALKAEGSFDALIAAHIDGASPAAEPAAVTLPVTPGAETIKVAVTGDLPPIDYTTAAGEPAGFNVALLAALSEQAGVNIELVSIDSSARALALSSDRADAVFWMRSLIFPDGTFNTDDDVPPGVALTDYYYIDTFKLVTVK